MGKNETVQTGLALALTVLGIHTARIEAKSAESLAAQVNAILEQSGESISPQDLERAIQLEEQAQEHEEWTVKDGLIAVAGAAFGGYRAIEFAIREREED